jgi:hypothetical protein
VKKRWPIAVLGGIFLVIAAADILTGRTGMRNSHIERATDPLYFWIIVGFWVQVGALLVVAAFLGSAEDVDPS